MYETKKVLLEHGNSVFVKTSKVARRENSFFAKSSKHHPFSYFWLKKHTLINLTTKGVYTDKRDLYLVYQNCRVFNPFMSALIPTLRHDASEIRPPYSPSHRCTHRKNDRLEVCGLLLKALALFKTRICVFPYPIYGLTKV